MSLGMPLTSAEQEPHFAGLAVPAAREVVCLGRLDFMHDIKHHQTFGDFRFVIHELTAVRIAAPYSESNGLVHFISSMTCFKCSGIGGIGSRRNFMEPSAALEITELYFAASGSFVREILAEMAATAFLAVNGTQRDRFGNREPDVSSQSPYASQGCIHDGLHRDPWQPAP